MEKIKRVRFQRPFYLVAQEPVPEFDGKPLTAPIKNDRKWFKNLKETLADPLPFDIPTLKRNKREYVRVDEVIFKHVKADLRAKKKGVGLSSERKIAEVNGISETSVRKIDRTRGGFRNY